MQGCWWIGSRSSKSYFMVQYHAAPPPSHCHFHEMLMRWACKQPPCHCGKGETHLAYSAHGAASLGLLGFQQWGSLSEIVSSVVLLRYLVHWQRGHLDFLCPFSLHCYAWLFNFFFSGLGRPTNLKLHELFSTKVMALPSWCWELISSYGRMPLFLLKRGCLHTAPLIQMVWCCGLLLGKGWRKMYMTCSTSWLRGWVNGQESEDAVWPEVL